MPQGSVSSLQGGRTSLYLHTLYTDSIALPPSDSRPDRGVLTRATPIKDVNMYESFGVSAYSYTGSWSEDKTPNYFYNATASKSDGGYTLSSTHYWPGSSYKMKFFAYAPTANTQYVLSASLFRAMSTTKKTFSWQRRMNWPATPTLPWPLVSIMPLPPSGSCAEMTCR